MTKKPTTARFDPAFTAAKLTAIREKVGLSQRAMAIEIGIARQTYANYEHGVVDIPKVVGLACEMIALTRSALPKPPPEPKPEPAKPKPKAKAKPKAKPAAKAKAKPATAETPKVAEAEPKNWFPAKKTKTPARKAANKTPQILMEMRVKRKARELRKAKAK